MHDFLTLDQFYDAVFSQTGFDDGFKKAIRKAAVEINGRKSIVLPGRELPGIPKYYPSIASELSRATEKVPTEYADTVIYPWSLWYWRKPIELLLITDNTDGEVVSYECIFIVPEVSLAKLLFAIHLNNDCM